MGPRQCVRKDMGRKEGREWVNNPINPQFQAIFFLGQKILVK